MKNLIAVAVGCHNPSGKDFLALKPVARKATGKFQRKKRKPAGADLTPFGTGVSTNQRNEVAPGNASDSQKAVTKRVVIPILAGLKEVPENH